MNIKLLSKIFERNGARAILLVMLFYLTNSVLAEDNRPLLPMISDIVFEHNSLKYTVTAINTQEGEQESYTEPTLLDPLGMDLRAVGFVSGDLPCANDKHIASVVDPEGRYVAFCQSEGGLVSTLQVAPQDRPLIDLQGMSPLTAFLALTPNTVDVPAALLSGALLNNSDRKVSKSPVRFEAKSAIVPVVGTILPAVNNCSSPTYFKQNICSITTQWINEIDVLGKTHWCKNGKYTTAQRTSSAQGVNYPSEGRIVVAACGSQSTTLQRLAKGEVSDKWKVIYENSISPYHVLGRTIHPRKLLEKMPGPSGVEVPASDLRFKVISKEGGWFRYAGGFIKYFPVE